MHRHRWLRADDGDAESQNKIDELMQVTNDMNNLLSATKIATIFLDNDLNIKRFTRKSAGWSSSYKPI